MRTKRIYINNEPTKYIIYEDGRIYSEITNKFLKPFPNPQGYYLIDIHHNGSSYTRQLHRLVALSFIPNPDNLETVNHKDGIKSHNWVDNLEWMTRLDNVRHAWATGLAKPRYGTDNPANVYSVETIHKVCQLLEIGKLGNKQIAELCNVNVTLIRDIKFRNKWAMIAKLYDIRSVNPAFKELRKDISNAIDEGFSDLEIIERLQLPEHMTHYIPFIRRLNKRSLND